MIELLRAVMPNAGVKAELYAPLFAEALPRYGIATPLQVAMFLAQIAHESGELRHTLEVASGDAYEGRKSLGNTQPGDGPRFKGRGLIQLTGRANYTSFASLTGWDAVNHPELLEKPDGAVESACWFWQTNGLNGLAEGPDALLACTKRINGGTNGLADRGKYYARALRALDLMKEGQMPIPALLSAAFSAILPHVPALVEAFKGENPSEVTKRNTKTIEVVMEVAKEITGAANEQEAVEKINASPEYQEALRAGVKDRWYDISEAGGGGIEGARKADAERVAIGAPLIKSATFVTGLALLPLVYLVVISVTFNIGGNWTPELRGSIASSVIGLILGAMVGYYFGASRNGVGVPPVKRVP